MKRGELFFLTKKENLPTTRFIFFASGRAVHPIIEKLRPKLHALDIKDKDKTIVGFDDIEGVERVYLIGLGEFKNITGVIIKNALASATRKAQARRWKKVIVEYPDWLTLEGQDVGSAIGVGLTLGNYHFNTYKGKEELKANHQIDEFYIDIHKLKPDEQKKVKNGVEEGVIVARGVAYTRDLVNEPPQVTTPTYLAVQAKQIAQSSKGKIRVTALDQAACEKMGMGAYLGVAKGSVEAPQFIVLHYKPPGKVSEKRIALVGKSITFDSGGLSLKPAEAMEDMKIDMAGGATVLGVFSVLSALDVPVEVYGVLPACENMPSGHAMRPGDIVRSMNGKTIEVLNTDAEGRLALADALWYAVDKLKVDTIIDLATLTGACVVALGNDLAGVFANDKAFKKQFLEAAAEVGDEAWPMPLYKPYLKKMKSSIADLKNIGGGRYGGAITAALFLSEFVKDTTRWIHVDIAGPAYRTDEPSGMHSRGATGWGVQTIIKLLQSLDNHHY